MGPYKNRPTASLLTPALDYYFVESFKSYNKEVQRVRREVKTGSSFSNSVMSFKCSYIFYWNHDVVCLKFSSKEVNEMRLLSVTMVLEALIIMSFFSLRSWCGSWLTLALSSMAWPCCSWVRAGERVLSPLTRSVSVKLPRLWAVGLLAWIPSNKCQILWVQSISLTVTVQLKSIIYIT